ncbi:unnamed protein product [Callosobruchus maculatus]|uniref:alpha-glucosidase n=1 Tax=Callosobruchus maculatus TaxID=64391 RepID=A0A653BQW9_CALMS|nr:unnamed protein product [Callosobruchus maculatus]
MRGATACVTVALGLALCAGGHVVQVDLDDTLRYHHAGVEGEQPLGADAGDDWWKNAVFYQIYPRSFMDSDGDGIGDLKGVQQKLSYLKDLGITGAWLSPIFKSPNADQGYDISDYRTIDDVFGGNAALKELLAEAKKIGLKIILDFVPNHTSDEHQWFKDSVKRTRGYEDFYVWADGKIDDAGLTIPPNNWISTFKGSAWTWNDDRKQFYLHQFSEKQPDLNYTNPDVIKAMEDVMDFWMDMGVDGFRVDAVPYLVEDKDMRDEPLANNSHYDQNDADCLQRIYTKDTDGTYNVVYGIRKHVDDYAKAKKQPTKVLMSEAYTDIDKTMKYYGSDDGKQLGAHFTFNFELLGLIKDKNFKVTDIVNAINLWWKHMPKIYTPNWVLGNHDNHRVATRLGEKNVDAFNMLTAFLPGIMVTYNGEEIGMTDGQVTCEQGKDEQAKKDCSTFNETSRDFERTPMQWDDTKNAGFSTSDTVYLPVASNYKEVNVKVEKGKSTSHLEIYKQLLKFRKEHLQTTSTRDDLKVDGVSEKVFRAQRIRDDTTYTLLFNVDDTPQEVKLASQHLLLSTQPATGAHKVGSVS